jgi:hypothetical protein
MITLRKAIPDDKKDYTELMLMAAPFFPVLFGGKIKTKYKIYFSDILIFSA